LPFALVAVGTAKDDAVMGVQAECTVDDVEGDEGVAPSAAEMEPDLVVGYAGAFEVD